MDSSPLAIKAARLFGVKKTLCLSIDQLGEQINDYNTLILSGTTWAPSAPPSEPSER